MEKVKKKIKIKYIVIALIVIAVLTVAVVAEILNKNQEEKGMMVNVAEVTKETIEKKLALKGTLKGSQMAEIQSSKNSEIKKILVKEGDKVKQNQLLAILDDGDLSERYAKAKITLAEARRKYEAGKKIFEQGGISSDEYYDLESRYETEKLNLSSFDFSEKEIKSPVSGTVTRVNVTVGSNSNSNNRNSPMFVVEDLEDLNLKVYVGEYSIAKVKVGQSVEITSEVTNDEKLKGKVTHIAPSGEKKQDSNDKVVPVDIEIKDPEKKLMPGITASAKILIDKKENALSIPVESLVEENGKKFVFIVKNKKLSKIEVETGIENAFNVEIKSDKIKVGDKIVLMPSSDMKDGTKVQISEGEAM